MIRETVETKGITAGMAIEMAVGVVVERDTIVRIAHLNSKGTLKT